MSQQEAMEFVGKYKSQIDEAIAQELEKRLQEVTLISPHLESIIKAMQELSGGGKRLRAILVVLGCSLAGSGINNEIVKAATVMELFHLGLLCQDDVFDRDVIRRGVKTIHARYKNLHLGEGLAVLAGDFTFAWGIEILSSLSLPPERINPAMRIWGKYFARVGYGEALDVLSEQREIASEADILTVARLKSGEYSCVLPLTLGAVLGGANQELLAQLEQYALELGNIFQLRDDWLAEYGDTQKTGKPVGNDSREGKKTFVTMYGRDRTETAIREHLEKGSQLAGDNQILQGLLEWSATRES